MVVKGPNQLTVDLTSETEDTVTVNINKYQCDPATSGGMNRCRPWKVHVLPSWLDSMRIGFWRCTYPRESGLWIGVSSAAALPSSKGRSGAGLRLLARPAPDPLLSAARPHKYFAWCLSLLGGFRRWRAQLESTTVAQGYLGVL